jgi:ribosomal-protein-alanine N-acetyltransferase
MNIREIKTARLSLRPFTLADVEAIHQLWIEPGMRKYLWDDEIIPKEKAREVIYAKGVCS